MTGAAKKPRRSRAKIADPRLALLFAALPHAAFDGFSDRVLKRAASEAGIPESEIARHFPNGALGLVETFSEYADSEMTRLLAKAKLDTLKIRERISLAIKTRLAVLAPHKEAARRAAAFLSLPHNAATGLKLLYRTVDAIWRGIGDTSTDFSFYTKRATLAGVYSTTLMRWFSDGSEDSEPTHDFLHRRIEDVMRFEKFKAKMRERASTLPSLSDILSPSKRPHRRPSGHA
jgi:ubiquinone biosynthesis protein COQ9